MKIKYILPEGLNLLIKRIMSLKYRNRRIDHVFENTNHNRISLITRALFQIKSPTPKYLEIGVFKNEVFDSIPLGRDYKTGVDPNEGGNIRKKSDDFFATNKSCFDVIFIDGLHTYEQVKKDIENSLKILNKNGFIFIHDLIPDSKISSKVERGKFTSNWNGDVFRVIFDIIKNDYLNFIIVNVDFGVGILRKVENKNIELNSNSYNYDYFLKNKSKLPIVSLEEAFKFIEK